MNIGIRADANETIGQGHIMRCLSIAAELHAMGHTPVFLCARPQPAVTEAGFACVVIQPNSMEHLMFCLQEQSIPILLSDFYGADTAYYEQLMQGGIRTAVLFDYGNANIPCNLLIDYNINYSNYTFPNAKATLLGTKYAPLRQEFRNLPERSYSGAHRILITAGGADPAGATPAVLRALRREPAFSGMEIDVVVGGMNPLAAKITADAQTMDGVFLFENIHNMAMLMQQADIVVSAGGSTLYEICASGLPCVAFSIAKNQDDMIAALHSAGLMLQAGIWRRGPQECVHNIVREVKLLTSNETLRESLGSRAQSMVDGNGAHRIACAIASL